MVSYSFQQAVVSLLKCAPDDQAEKAVTTVDFYRDRCGALPQAHVVAKRRGCFGVSDRRAQDRGAWRIVRNSYSAESIYRCPRAVWVSLRRAREFRSPRIPLCALGKTSAVGGVARPGIPRPPAPIPVRSIDRSTFSAFPAARVSSITPVS